jgi:hypothetical protein
MVDLFHQLRDFKGLGEVDAQVFGSKPSIHVTSRLFVGTIMWNAVEPSKEADPVVTRR